MKNGGKSPESDGFTVEISKVFSKKMVRAINDGFDKREMSPSQKEGIIICILKED